MKLFFVLLLFIVPHYSLAAKYTTYFFGGVGADHDRLTKCYPESSQYKVYAYEDGIRKAESDFQADFTAHPTQEFLIVGHSNGTKNAHAFAASLVAAKLDLSKRVTVVNLEGFRPGNEYGLKVPVKKNICWTAIGRKGSQAPNYEFLQECHPLVSKNTGCNTELCLHFSLINASSAIYDLGAKDYYGGYAGCQGNFEWMRNL